MPQAAPSARAFEGVLSPNLTPYGPDLSPDPKAYVTHAKWLLANGVDALAPFGTTSEGNSLSVDEKLMLLDALLEAGVPGAKMMPGTGTCALPDSVRLTKASVEAGCGGVLLLPPFYYKGVSEDGVFAAISETIQRVGDARLRVYLYHIPPQAQIGFSIDLIDRLLKAYPGVVVGLKDSSGDWANMSSLMERFPGFDVFPGSELFLLDGLRAGAPGTITASSNVNARAIRAVVDAHLSGGDADAAQAEITKTRKALQTLPMIPALKAIAAQLHGDAGWRRVRPPLLALPDAQSAAAREIAAGVLLPA